MSDEVPSAPVIGGRANARTDPARRGAAEPGSGTDGLEGWERAAWGAAIGGLAVWGLAAAARAGWLRALLDLYPRSSWERITWVLIPVLLLLPVITQGTAVAVLAPSRPIPAGRGIVGSIAGTLCGFAAGLAVFVLAGRVPGIAGGAAARAVPVPLALGCWALLIAASLNVAGRLYQMAWLRLAAAPAAAAAALAAWVVARGWVVAAASILDRAETAVFFVAVAVGGGVGSAWSVGGRGRAD